MAFRLHGADRVGNLFRDAFFFHGAGCVGNPLRTGFPRVGAGRVRDFASHAFGFPSAGDVRNLLGGRAGNDFAYRVGHFAVLHFLDHPSALNLLLDGFRTPDFTATGCYGTLNFFSSTFPGLVHIAAPLSVPFPRSRITNAAFHNRTGYMLSDRLPFSAFDLNSFGFGHRPANRVANIFVESFGNIFVRGATDITIMGFVNWFANGRAAFSVLSFVMRLANRVTALTVIGGINRFANFVSYFPVTSLVVPFLNSTCDIAVASLIDRLAHVVTFITVQRFINIS